MESHKKSNRWQKGGKNKIEEEVKRRMKKRNKKQCQILVTTRLKPGLHISRKDRKHRFENMFFKLSSYGLVSMW